MKPLKLALALLEAATTLFPPLSKGIGDALRSLDVADDDKPLVEEVLARLPEESASARVARELEE